MKDNRLKEILDKDGTVWANPDGFNDSDRTELFVLRLGGFSQDAVLVFADHLQDALDTVADDVLLKEGETPDCPGCGELLRTGIGTEADCEACGWKGEIAGLGLPRTFDAMDWSRDPGCFKDFADDALSADAPPFPVGGTKEERTEWWDDLDEEQQGKVIDAAEADTSFVGGYGLRLNSDDWSYEAHDVPMDEAIDAAQDFIIRTRVVGPLLSAAVITERQTWWRVETSNGSDLVHTSLVSAKGYEDRGEMFLNDNGFGLAGQPTEEAEAVVLALLSFLEADRRGVYSLEAVTGHFCQLSAPGYMDQTEWSGPHDTVRKAKQDLIDNYERD